MGIFDGVNPELGLQPPGEQPVRAIVRAAAMAVGDVMAFDLVGSDANVTTFGAGQTTSGWCNVRAPSAAETLNTAITVIAVCTEAAAQDARGSVVVVGYVTAFVIDAAASVVVGDQLMISTAKNFDAGTAVASRIIAGIANAALTTPTTRTLASVYCWGWRGLFVVAA